MRCAFIESDVTSVLIKIKLTAGRGEPMLMCVLVELATVDNLNQGHLSADEQSEGLVKPKRLVITLTT